MNKTQINPWTWQDAFGFSQAWTIEGARTLVVVSGQASISATGDVLHAHDFPAQVRLTFENLRTVLERSGASLDDVVKLTGYLVGMEHLAEFATIQGEYLGAKRPAQTVVGVTSLALPGMLVEVEALAVL